MIDARKHVQEKYEHCIFAATIHITPELTDDCIHSSTRYLGMMKADGNKWHGYSYELTHSQSTSLKSLL